MPAIGPPTRTASWTEYWAAGALHSCPGSFRHNYDGDIAAFWSGCFDALPDGFRMVDLCTGNGAIPQLLSEHPAFRERAGTVQAFDLVDVHPQWRDALEPNARDRIRFIGGVDAARLPCADASVDLVSSQFGIEYIGGDAFAEVARALCRGGRLAAVLHHPEGLPVRIAREECAHHAWLRTEDWAAAVAAMVAPMAQSASEEGRTALRSDVSAQHAKQRYDALLGALRARASISKHPDLLHEAWQQSASVFATARAHGGAAAHAAWHATLARMHNAELRQQELAACAVESSQLEAWAAQLGDRAPEIGTVHFVEGSIAGWRMSARRAG